MSKGKIVVLEGVDGTGKTTQYNRLCDRFKNEGMPFSISSFPNYNEPSCYFVESYLHGLFGTQVNEINPKLASTFYTVDRYASYKLKEWGKTYDAGGNVLLARYITSNILHQASKYKSWEEKREFIDWLYNLETGIFELPKEDCVILLDVPFDINLRMKAKRDKENHGITSSGTTVDIHESNIEYLRHSYETAIQACDYLGWKRVNCIDSNENLRSIESIHEEVYSIAKQVFEKN